jgi:hypothetical protein
MESLIPSQRPAVGRRIDPLHLGLSKKVARQLAIVGPANQVRTSTARREKKTLPTASNPRAYSMLKVTSEI